MSNLPPRDKTRPLAVRFEPRSYPIAPPAPTYQVYPRAQLRACAVILDDAATAMTIFMSGNPATDFKHYPMLTRAERLLADPTIQWPLVVKRPSVRNSEVKRVIEAANDVVEHLMRVDRAYAETLREYIVVPSGEMEVVSTVLRADVRGDVTNRQLFNLREPHSEGAADTGREGPEVVWRYYDFELVSEECLVHFRTMVMTLALMRSGVYGRMHISEEEAQAQAVAPPPYEELVSSEEVSERRPVSMDLDDMLQ